MLFESQPSLCPLDCVETKRNRFDLSSRLHSLKLTLGSNERSTLNVNTVPLRAVCSPQTSSAPARAGAIQRSKTRANSGRDVAADIECRLTIELSGARADV